jgi:hypothetical protein
MNCNFLNSKINILTETADGELYVLEADSAKELLEDWNNECDYVPGNDAKIYFASYNGNVMNHSVFHNFGTFMGCLQEVSRYMKED